EVEAWGRQLGKHAGEQRGTNKHPITLPFAARVLGDALAVWVRRDRERHESRMALSQCEAYEARFKDAYRRYLLGCEVRLQEQDPTRYRKFLAYREERRERIVRFARGGAQSALMRGFDTEGARMEAFREFCSAEVLDFAAWDAHRIQQTLAT